MGERDLDKNEKDENISQIQLSILAFRLKSIYLSFDSLSEGVFINDLT